MDNLPNDECHQRYEEGEFKDHKFLNLTGIESFCDIGEHRAAQHQSAHLKSVCDIALKFLVMHRQARAADVLHGFASNASPLMRDMFGMIAKFCNKPL